MPVDGTEGCLRAFIKLKQQYPTLKVLLSIGGGGTGSQHYASVARNPLTVERFVASAKDLADKFGLDGFDINWEHPSTPHQGSDYLNLLIRLRLQFPSPTYLLTTALPAGEWALRNINLSWAHHYLDHINLMAYDFSGPWTTHSGHQAQLFTAPPPSIQGQGTSSSDASCAAAPSCQAGVSYVLAQGVPAKKILLGIPVYGRAFPGASGVGQPYEGVGGEERVFDYRDLPRRGAREMHDDLVVAAYCVDVGDGCAGAGADGNDGEGSSGDGDGGGAAGFISYDSTRTVRQKARFVAQMQLGGLFYWHIAADAVGERSLVATGYNALHEF
ncbi:hypothetical protein AJ79_06329 [Helicocarpus griseus UAMH5409]|uniref:chitinase n=1 Tax=Helicocarpus griseus UAMH5409 TaxID=1447875 RepID=A0A2B7XE53_9EURO|nr:hypothetical protein AJ79_06329 [Helicocarpus griseus UAMH5409]